MATIDINPIMLSDILATIAADNYEAHFSKVQLDPTTPKAIWKGMTPGAIKPVLGTPTWLVTLDYAQDFATATAFARYLQLNAGTVKTFTFTPKKKVGATTVPTYTIDIMIEHGPIGGALDTIATGTVQLQAVGQPVYALA